MYGLLFLLKHAGTAFHNAIVLQHLPNGAEEAPAVKEKAEILDILAVQTGFHRNFQLIPAIDLRPAGEARTYPIGAVFCHALQSGRPDSRGQGGGPMTLIFPVRMHKI